MELTVYAELYSNLQEERYATMRPFGRSLTYLLPEPRQVSGGRICRMGGRRLLFPPLAQEREAALDEFFDALADIPHINFGSEFRRPTYDEWSKLISPPTSRQRFPRHLSAEKGLWPLGYPGAFAEIRQAETPLQGLVQKTLAAKPYSISIGQSETISRPIPPC